MVTKNIFCLFQIPSSPVRSSTRPKARHLQARRLQRSPMERGQAQAPIPAGYLYNPRGCAVALDVARVRPFLYPLLATLRSPLVAHHLHPRGLEPRGTRRELQTLP